MSPEFVSSFRWGCLLGLMLTFIVRIADIFIIQMKSQSNCQTSLFLALSILFVQCCFCTNTSVCNTFSLAGVYYTINSLHSAESIKTPTSIYNFCEQVEFYCESNHKVITGSMIVRQGCFQYLQNDVLLIDESNITKGVKIIYKAKSNNLPVNVSEFITLVFACEQGNQPGCPDVDQSTIFTFFIKHQLGFMIALEVIGVIFMTLGLYIYRASIVLLGACTMFFILLAIEVPIIFTPGVPSDIISNILIISGICSFFAGYVFGYFPKLGIFLLGCWIGLIISLTLNNIAFYFIKSNPANLTLWIVMPIFCLLFGILSLFIRKTFIIFATSLIGAYMCLRALSWYLGAFPNQFLLARKYHLGLSGPVPWQFYLYVIALVILTASSSALQFWLFTKKSELSNQSKNIDEQFGDIQAKMKAERSNLAEITNFKEIFKGKQGKEPKVLRKRSEHSDSLRDSQSESQQAQQIDEEDLEDADEEIKAPEKSKKSFR